MNAKYVSNVLHSSVYVHVAVTDVGFCFVSPFSLLVRLCFLLYAVLVSAVLCEIKTNIGLNRGFQDISGKVNNRALRLVYTG